jgi:hypothetical protein
VTGDEALWRTERPRSPGEERTLDASTLSNAFTTLSTRSVTSALSRYDVAKVLLIIDPNTGADSVRWAATGVPFIKGEDATVLIWPDFAERRARSTNSAA